jgi:hypothetical protein
LKFKRPRRATTVSLVTIRPRLGRAAFSICPAGSQGIECRWRRRHQAGARHAPSKIPRPGTPTNAAKPPASVEQHLVTSPGYATTRNAREMHSFTCATYIR